MVVFVPPTSRSRFTWTTAATSGHSSGSPSGSQITVTYRSPCRPCPSSTAADPSAATPTNSRSHAPRKTAWTASCKDGWFPFTASR